MLFEPLIHTKQFLIDNPEILHILASGSIEFCRSPLAQDYELLKQNHEYGGVVAHVMNPEWMTTPASQDFNILSIKCSTGWAVAHRLTSYKEWRNTPAARDMSVLTVKGKSGYTVAHMLEYEFVSELSNSKEIMMISTDELNSVAQGFLEYLPLENAEKVICFLIERGAAYEHKFTQHLRSKWSFSFEQFKSLISAIDKIINEEPDGIIKLKKSIAAYSTIINLSNTLINVTGSKENKAEYDAIIEELSSTINSLVVAHGLTVDDAVKFEDFNCGPGIGLLNQIFNKSLLEEINLTKSNEEQEVVSINPLY